MITSVRVPFSMIISVIKKKKKIFLGGGGGGGGCQHFCTLGSSQIINDTLPPQKKQETNPS
jgi:hypothetical protein